MVEITWLGHSTFQLRLPSGEVLVLDPWTEDNPKFPKTHTFDRIDAIVLSHAHFDHIGDCVRLAKQFSPKVYAIFELAQWLGSKDVANVTGMNKGGSAVVCGVTVTMTHALHSSSILDDGKLIYGGEAAGWVLRFQDGRSAYFAGDTTVFGDMKLIHDLYKPELAFLPVGDLFTMGPPEAALACQLIQPDKVIPMHWGTFPALIGTPQALAAQLQEAGSPSQVWELVPGQPVSW